VKWPTIEALSARAPLPAGYRYERLTRARIPEVIRMIADAYPSISVGNASCFLRENWYQTKVHLDEASDRDFLVVLFRHGDDLAGIFAVERDVDSQVIYGRIAVIAPAYRGAHLSRNCLLLEEAIGTEMGMGLIYGLATLSYPQMQATFERMGWRLVGITPGFDRELVAPGIVKRVYEAVYMKVLVTDDELLRPHAKNMTPAAKALFDLLFPGRCIEP
jgi:hypothetical protein